MTSNQTVLFYKAGTTYPQSPNIIVRHEFGNFHLVPGGIQIQINNTEYNFKCAEAAFQAGKYTDRPIIIKELEKCNGEAAFRISRTYKSNIGNWDLIKNIWMMDVLRVKFSNYTMKKLLMETRGCLIERPNTKTSDNYWSDGFDGNGSNILGISLMKIREELGGNGFVKPSGDYYSLIKIQTSKKICEFCGIRSCFGNYDYCSKTCGQLAKNNSCKYCKIKPHFGSYDYCSRTCGRLANDNCKYCKIKPRFGSYDYCSRTCGQLAKK